MSGFEINWRNSDVSIDEVMGRTTESTVNIDGQLLNVISADGSNGHSDRPTVIWPQAFMARARDPLEVYRVQLLASRLQTKVASVDRPGVSFDPRKLEDTDAGESNITHLGQAARGDIDGLSTVQLDALDRVINFKHGEELHLFGYSFGAWSVSSMAAVLGRQHFGSDRQPHISGMTLLEAVNDQPLKLNTLRANMGSNSSTENISRYLVQNEKLGIPEVKFFDWQSALERSPGGTKIHSTLGMRQALPLFLPALGLRHGFAKELAETIQTSPDTTRLNEAKITIARADGSTVARKDANEHTAQMLGNAETIDLLAPDDESSNKHPLVHSMGIVAVLTENLIALQPDMN